MRNVALIGNPNSGKTTLYNELTGSNQSVGNWPGVTVEKKTGKLKSSNGEVNIVDLPGIYSLSTISLEEEIAANYVVDRKMDLIVNIVDASNLERNLFLSLQLIEAGIPMIIALNAMDIVEKKKEEINYVELSNLLGIQIVPISARKKTGIEALIHAIDEFDYNMEVTKIRYSDEIEDTIDLFTSYIKNRFIAHRFFEDGIKAIANVKIDKPDLSKLLQAHYDEKNKYDLDFDMILPNARYDRIFDFVEKTHMKSDIYVESETDKIDKILTHKYLGLPIFGLIMFTVFFLAFGPIGIFITNQFIWLINQFFALIIDGVASLGMAPFVSSLITNGVFGGLAAVIGFLPQLAILFFALAILEDSGYMARAAFIMDKVLRRFGLSGKSFIPMLIGFGCSVPAMANTRTLDQDEDRKITTMIIPFISCGAKAPIYGVFAGALFGGGSFIVVFSMYILGMLVAIFSAVLFKKTIFKGAKANYIMELPEYRKPTLKNTLMHTWERSKDFLVKAGTILLAAFMIIWFFSYFGVVDGEFRLLAESEIGNSLLGSIGRFILPIFKPIGFTDWQATVAMLTGIVAKESVVGTLGILYGVNGDVVTNGTLLYSSIQASFTTAQAYSFMVFALLSTPCIAAVAAMKRELNSWKWFTFIILYEVFIAYLIAFGVYQLASIPIGNTLTYVFSALALVFVGFMIRKFIRNKGSICGDCSSCNKTSGCHLPKFTNFKEGISNSERNQEDE
ncbi:MAG: ferrous iron transport protein B [Tenericutes bacterium]|nr:ferrous iron transport protein B [Mycoplasmatota bacterium]